MFHVKRVCQYSCNNARLPTVKKESASTGSLNTEYPIAATLTSFFSTRTGGRLLPTGCNVQIPASEDGSCSDSQELSNVS